MLPKKVTRLGIYTTCDISEPASDDLPHVEVAPSCMVNDKRLLAGGRSHHDGVKSCVGFFKHVETKGYKVCYFKKL